jgi:DNA-binding transcriptional regulator YdaS (Cro superfamily)
MKLVKYLEKEKISQARFAELLEVTPGAVSQWCNGYPIAPENVLKIERATGGKVTRHELRPDVYPRETAA